MSDNVFWWYFTNDTLTCLFIYEAELRFGAMISVSMGGILIMDSALFERKRLMSDFMHLHFQFLPLVILSSLPKHPDTCSHCRIISSSRFLPSTCTFCYLSQISPPILLLPLPHHSVTSSPISSHSHLLTLSRLPLPILHPTFKVASPSYFPSYLTLNVTSFAL